ncbi:MAG: PAS domain S-box protein [Verrucomicrobiae bacterium]|nr:PAS domain S-box protein [Verrucomicrobiae bacterium]
MDLNTPLGVSGWVWYFIPLWLSLYVNRQTFPYLLAALISVLLMAGLELSPRGNDWQLSFISRSVGISVIWLVALLIDARIRVDVALRASEVRHRLVLEDQTAVICRFTAEGTLLFVNEAYCRVFGKTRSELLGSKWHPRVVSEDLPMIEERLRGLSRASPEVVIENRIYNDKGEVRWFQFINHGVFDPAGTLVEMQSVGQDITERRRVEIKLEETHRMLTAMCDSSTDAIFIKDVQGRYLTFNREAAKMVGKKPEEVIGHDDFSIFPAPEAKVVMDGDRKVMAGGEPLTYEERVTTTKGVVTYLSTKGPIDDGHGRVIGLFGIARDITERKRAEEKINNAYGLLAAMCDSSTDAIYIKDVQGRYLIFNAESAKLVGKTPKEVIGQDDYFIFPPSEAERIRAEDRKVMESGQVITYEDAVTTTLGTIIHLTTKGPIYDAAGKMSGVFGVSRDITGRKRVEQSLKLMEERYRSLAESTPDAIFILDRNSTIQYINRVGARWLGKPVEEVLGRTRTEFFPADLARQQQASLQRVFATGELLHAERSQTFPGGAKWIETRLVPLRDEHGTVVSAMGISRDLTERRQAEVQLATLAHAVQSTAEMICITDMEDRFTFANPAFLKVYGYTEAELLGKSPAILLSPDNPPTLLGEIMAQSRAGGWRGEVLDRRKDGTDFWIYLSTSQVKVGDGEVIGLMGVSRDITAHKLAEEKIQELAAIVQSSEDAIISIGPGEIIASWNKGAEQLLGYNAGEAVGQDISIIVPPEQLGKSRSVIRQAARGEPGETYESIRRHKDGSLRHVSVRVSPVINLAGKVISIAAIMRDISARMGLEKTILEIGAAERRRMGHELHDGLGQQLTGIAFKSKALQEGLAGVSSRFAADAQTIVKLINEAIQQTRNLARGFDPVDFEVDGLPAALRNLAAHTEAVYDIECIFQCNEERLDLDSQTNLTLYRITQEALSNAVKHGRARRIRIDLQARSAKLVLTIRDNGAGFCPDQKSPQGMGLRVMSYRANTVGGMLAIHSEVDVGTEIRCLLPKVPVRG